MENEIRILDRQNGTFFVAVKDQIWDGERLRSFGAGKTFINFRDAWIETDKVKAFLEKKVDFSMT